MAEKSCTIKLSDRAHMTFKMCSTMSKKSMTQLLEDCADDMIEKYQIKDMIDRLYPVDEPNKVNQIDDLVQEPDQESDPDPDQGQHPWFRTTSLPDFRTKIRSLTKSDLKIVVDNLQYYTEARQREINAAHYKAFGSEIELVEHIRKQ